MPQQEVMIMTKTGEKHPIKFFPDQSVGGFVFAVGKMLNLPVSTIRLFFCGRELKPPTRKMADFDIGKFENFIIHLQTTTIEVVDNDNSSWRESHPSHDKHFVNLCEDTASHLLDIAEDNDVPRFVPTLRGRRIREIRAKQEAATRTCPDNTLNGRISFCSANEDVIDLLSDDCDAEVNASCNNKEGAVTPIFSNGIIMVDLSGNEEQNSNNNMNEMYSEVNHSSEVTSSDMPSKLPLPSSSISLEDPLPSESSNISDSTETISHSTSQIDARRSFTPSFLSDTLYIQGEKRKTSSNSPFNMPCVLVTGVKTVLVHSEIHFPSSGKRLTNGQWLELVGNSGVNATPKCCQGVYDNSIRENCLDESYSRRDSTIGFALNCVDDEKLVNPSNDFSYPSIVSVEDQVWITFKVMEKVRSPSITSPDITPSVLPMNSLEEEHSIKQGQSDNTIHRVTIGQYFTCSCGESEILAPAKDNIVTLCRHVVFILNKVLGVPLDSRYFLARSLLQLEVWELGILYDYEAFQRYHNRLPDRRVDSNIDSNDNEVNRLTPTSEKSVSNLSPQQVRCSGSVIEAIQDGLPVSSNSLQSDTLSSACVANVVTIADDIEDEESEDVVLVARTPAPQDIVDICSDEEEEDDICCCCFEEMNLYETSVSSDSYISNREDIVTCSQCNKSLHKDCLQAWQKRNETCPYCRSVWRKEPKYAYKKRKRVTWSVSTYPLQPRIMSRRTFVGRR